MDADRRDDESSRSSLSIDVTESMSLTQHQQNLETLNRMGMLLQARHMAQSLQSLDAVKGRLAGPRHSIDAILGLSGRQYRDAECEPAGSPGAAESAGELRIGIRMDLFCVMI